MKYFPGPLPFYLSVVLFSCFGTHAASTSLAGCPRSVLLHERNAAWLDQNGTTISYGVGQIIPAPTALLWNNRTFPDMSRNCRVVW